MSLWNVFYYWSLKMHVTAKLETGPTRVLFRTGGCTTWLMTGVSANYLINKMMNELSLSLNLSKWRTAFRFFFHHLIVSCDSFITRALPPQPQHPHVWSLFPSGWSHLSLRLVYVNMNWSIRERVDAAALKQQTQPHAVKTRDDSGNVFTCSCVFDMSASLV